MSILFVYYNNILLVGNGRKGEDNIFDILNALYYSENGYIYFISIFIGSEVKITFLCLVCRVNKG